MADNFMINITEHFDIEKFIDAFNRQYLDKEFKVYVFRMKNGVKFRLEKRCGGINNLLGLGKGISARCILVGKEKNVLSIIFSEGDWRGKIVGLGVGVVLCFIPLITAIVGCVRQLDLPDEIVEDIQAIVDGMGE